MARVGLLSVLTCQTVVEVVTDYLEDALSACELADIVAHFLACGECSCYVDQMRRTVHCLRTVGPDLPIPSRDDLVKGFRGQREGSG